MRLVRARYCNIKINEIIRAVKKTFFNFESKSITDYFYYYIIGVLKLIDISWMNCDYITIQDVNDFNEWFRKYKKLSLRFCWIVKT